jgi:hypothetical protein
MVVGPAIGGAVSTHMGEQESFILHTPVFCCARRTLEYVYERFSLRRPNHEKYLFGILTTVGRVPKKKSV